ncbi:MAG: hypothetical protein WBE52_17915, partial [Terriglobales bacterium]
MRNTWLIIKREYLERVRTRSFMVLTLLLPAIVAAVMVLPAKLATIGKKAQHVVVVTSNPQFGEIVRQGLLSSGDNDDDEAGSETNAAKQARDKQYIIDVDSNPTEAERAALSEKVSSQAIDGYLWLSDDAIASGKVTWVSRNMPGSGERSRLSEKLSRIVQYTRLSSTGLTGNQANLLLKPIKVEAVRMEHGRETRDSTGMKLIEVVVMVMLLYMAVLLYGISVMR